MQLAFLLLHVLGVSAALLAGHEGRREVTLVVEKSLLCINSVRVRS